jgi:hypothetical protein
LPVKEIDTGLKQAEITRTSFADLKKGRQTKKTFAKPTASAATSVDESPESPSSIPLEKVYITDTPTPAPISAHPKLSSEALPLLDPTIPGSALSLISAIRTHSTQATWPVIAALSKQPEAVGKMLDNFLEPNQLALILARLRDTISIDVAKEDERKKVVIDFVAGLRMTKRWGMTAMMLSSKEKQLGQEVWTSAGGTGDWTKKS